jgi:hypothetical protein
LHLAALVRLLGSLYGINIPLTEQSYLRDLGCSMILVRAGAEIFGGDPALRLYLCGEQA